ncbi:MAG: hypothetical protein ACRCYS_16010 [Beijerinckiaceae bacterium]
MSFHLPIGDAIFVIASGDVVTVKTVKSYAEFAPKIKARRRR